ncbi:MAG: hypothetical protein ABIQ40_00610 [Bacteroidia bacterium]
MTLQKIKDNKLFRYFADPFVFVSIFGPILVDNNFNLVGSKGSYEGIQPDFQNLFKNEYCYAFTSYNIQLFVLYIAISLVLIESISCFVKSHNSPHKANKHLNTAVIFAFFIIVGGFFLVFFSGSFASEKLVDLYLKKNAIKPIASIDIAIPPPKSLITIWRGLIVIYGVIFAVWKNKVLPAEKASA